MLQRRALLKQLWKLNQLSRGTGADAPRKVSKRPVSWKVGAKDHAAEIDQPHAIKEGRGEVQPVESALKGHPAV